MPALPPVPRGDVETPSGPLTRAVEAIRSLFGAAACSCALVEADGTAVRFAAAGGEGADGLVGRRLPLDRGLVGWVALTGQPIATADLAADPRFARDVAAETGYVPTSIMAAPLIASAGEVLGVVEVLDRATAGDHTGRDLQTLGVLAAQLASIVELAATRNAGPDDDLEDGLLTAGERRRLGADGRRLVRRLALAVLESSAEAE